MKKLLGIGLGIAAVILLGATITGAVLSATVTVTDSSGSEQTNVPAPFGMTTSGLIDSGVLATTTLNVQLCETGTSCPEANEVPMAPSASRTRIFSAQHFSSSSTTFTVETADANDGGANDVTLIGAVPAIDDAFYFIADHPFRVIWMNIGVAGGRATEIWTFAWEYWNGSAYAAVSNVSDNSDAFTNAATSTITWDIAADMSATTTNGVTGFPVRARITAAGSGTVTQALGTQIWYEPGLWWVFNDSVAGSAAQAYTLWMGGPDIRTFHHAFPGTAGFDTVDHADLELGADFELVVDAFVDVTAGLNKNLALKTGSFELFVSTTTDGTIVSRIWSTATETLRPDGAGDFTNIDNQTPGSGAHWDKVDEVSADDTVTEVNTANAAEQQDAYTLNDPALPTGSVINQVEVFFRTTNLSSGQSRPLLRLASTSTLGTLITPGTSWTLRSEVLGKPGGGDWEVGNLQDLQVGIGLAENAGGIVPRATQVFVEVEYDFPTDVTVTGLSTGSHRVTASATSSVSTLRVDSSTATSSVTISMPDNSNAWDFVSGGSVVYMASTSITVSSSQVLHWQINRPEDALTITDRAGTQQNATSSFPALSSTISATVSAFETTNPPSAVSNQQASGIPVSIASTTIFATTTNIGSGLPGGVFLAGVAANANVPVAFLWIMLASGLIVVIIVVVQSAIKNILYAVIAGGIAFTAFATPAVGVFPIWSIMFYAILGGVAVIIGRRLGVSV